jgi:Zn-dependent protease
VSEQLVAALAAVGIMLLVGFPVHEFCHAWAAHRLGDNTARWQGRLTLDPRVHFDPIGGLMLAFTALLSAGSFFFGYAKPTPVNPMNLAGGRRGETYVAVAGPLSNLVMAAIVAVPLRVILATPDLRRVIAGNEIADFAILVAFYFVIVNIFLFLFNLLPIPPLDGWRAILGLVPSETAWRLREIETRYAAIIPVIFIAFIFLGGSRVLGPIAAGVRQLLLGF